MKKGIFIFVALAFFGYAAYAQVVKWPAESVKRLCPEWTGERTPDGRPKVPEDLLERLKNVSMEEAWGFLRGRGYEQQFENFASTFENGWVILYPDQPMTGRVVTAQFMPERPDFDAYIQAQGEKDGITVPVTNYAPILALSEGDVYVADAYGKMEYGTLIGDNLGNAIYQNGKRGIIYNGSVRDVEGLMEIEGFNGWIRGSDPSAIRAMVCATVNAPIRIGRATVLPGDVVLAKSTGVIFIPAHLVEECVLSGEYTSLRDQFNFYCMRTGLFKYVNERFVVEPDEFEAAFLKWIDENPDILPMPKEDFMEYYKSRQKNR